LPREKGNTGPHISETPFSRQAENFFQQTLRDTRPRGWLNARGRDLVLPKESQVTMIEAGSLQPPVSPLVPILRTRAQMVLHRTKAAYQINFNPTVIIIMVVPSSINTHHK